MAPPLPALPVLGGSITTATSAAGDMLTDLFVVTLGSETRLYDIEVAGTTAPLAVEAFSIREGLSEISELRVLVLSTNAMIDLDDLQWQPVSLKLRGSDGNITRRSGRIRIAEALEADGGLARYALTVVPWLWLATQQTRSRIFQDKSVLQIVAEVFADYGDADWRLADGTQAFIDALPPRRVCTQYRETDHAFVQRLLTEEGLGYCFEEGEKGAGARLVIFADSTTFAEDISSQSALGGAGIRFHRASSQQDQDAIQTLVAVRELPSAALTAAAWDPDAKRIVAASLSTHRRYASDADVPALERYHWLGHGPRTGAGVSRSVELAQQASEARHKRYLGECTVRTFRPGTGFHLKDSPVDVDALFRGARQDSSADRVEDDDRTDFVLTRVTAVGINNLPAATKKAIDGLLGTPESWAADGSELIAPLSGKATASDLDALVEQARAHGYACRFESQRRVIPWRPEGAGLRSRATAEGPQSAIVTGVDGGASDELHRDAQGRIQVRFHWQRGDSAQDKSSGWVRVASRYAAGGMGASFVPRIGQEVLVGFIDQDIDQPIVLGGLYNGRGEGGDHPSPGGKSAGSAATGLFEQAQDRVPSAQANGKGGNAPAWHGASADPDGHRNAAGLSGFKSQEFDGGSGYNQLQHDDHDDELRSQLASTQATSQLNLGHLIHSADNHRGSQRGSGFELRTDQSAAIRGGAGVLLTTWRDGGGSQPIGDITAAIALLKQAKGLSDAFDGAATTHQTVGLSAKRGTLKAEASRLSTRASPLAAMVQAASAKVDADDDGKALSDAAQSLAAGTGAGGGVTSTSPSSASTGASPSVPHLGAPMVIAAAQDSLSLVAGQSIQIATGDTALFATGGDLNLAGGERLTLHSAQAIGILAGAAKAGEGGKGLSAIAAKGPVTVQAQADAMNLDSSKALTIVSANASTEFAAATSVRLATAKGASIEIEGGNIMVQCPGKLTVMAAQRTFAPGTQLSKEMNSWPSSQFDERIQLVNRDGTPAKNYRYEIHREDGAVIKGVTDGDGWTTMQKAVGLENIDIHFLGPA